MPRPIAPLFALALLASALPAADPPSSVARVANPDAARRALGLLPNYAFPRVAGVTVAVLDSGFDGVGPDRPYLPKSAVVVEHYDPAWVKARGLGDPDYKKPFAPGNAHGRVMAQVAWATTGGSPDGPRFLLLNANGPTLFRRAVRYAVESKADVILFAGAFEGAGNYDGRGPVNAAVDEAVRAGILWVNAAGNNGGKVYNGPVTVGPGGYLTFTGSTPGLTALRFRNRLDENAVTVTLTWNDYRDAEDAGTDKDLDLFVEDAFGKVVGLSTLRQVPAGRAAGEGETKNPRERVTLADLPAVAAGREYRIRVRANGPNWGPRDRVRILLSAARDGSVPDADTGKTVPAVDFLDATKGGELYPPADHPGVLTVGDDSPASSVGPTADGRSKPDVVVADSRVRLTNGDESAGSSNAAAYLAGVLAVLRAHEPGLRTGHVREWVLRLDLADVDRRTRGRVAQTDGLIPPPGAIGTLPATLRDPQWQALARANEERALRYAEQAAAEQRARGAGVRVVISGPRGELVIGPGNRPAAGSVPPAPPVAAERPPGPHANWQTPSPGALEALVRGGG